MLTTAEWVGETICTELARSELELWRVYLDALIETGLDEPANVLRPVLTYALGTGNAEVAILGVACEPDRSRRYTDREVLLYLGQALAPDTPPETGPPRRVPGPD